MIYKSNPGKPLWLGLVFLTIVAGCSPEARKSDLETKAETHFRAGQYQIATIDYLNLLKLDPTNQVAIRRLGMMAYEQGHVSPAHSYLSQLRELNPGDTQARLYWGLTLAMVASPEAWEEAAFVLEQEPTNGRALLLLADTSDTPEHRQDAEARLTRIEGPAGALAEFHIARGTLALRNRDMAAAETLFRKAVSLNPESAEAHAAMANLHLARNDREAAREELQTAADLARLRSSLRIRYADFLAGAGELNEATRLLEELSEQAPGYLPPLLRLAEFALSGKEFGVAEQRITSVLQSDPTSLRGRELQAQLRLDQGEPQRALVELDQALRLYPKLGQLHYQKARVLLVLEDEVGALESLDEALRHLPNYPEAALLRAELELRSGDSDGAVASLKMLLASRPGLVPAQMLLARVYRARGDLDNALELYQAVSQSETNDPAPVLLAGMVQRELGRTAEARQSFERALALSPNLAAALQQVVALDVEAERFEAAKARLQQAVEREGETVPLLLLLAKVQMAEGDQPAAEATLLHVAELDPELLVAQELLAGLYAKSGRYAEAIAKLQEVVAQQPDDTAAWFRMAYYHSASSNHVAAKAAYEKILEIDPGSLRALNNLATLYATQLNDLDQAYALAEKARAAHRDDPFVADTLGWILHLRGEEARALPLLQQSAAAFPNEPEVLYHFGVVQYNLGMEEGARAVLESLEGAPWSDRAAAFLEVLSWEPAGGSVEQLNEWMADRPREVPLLMRMAAVRESEGRWAEAARTYATVLEINPDLVPALVKLARLNGSQLNKPDEALALAQKARRLSPGDPAVSHTLGVLAFQSADYQRACSLLQETAVQRPTDPVVHRDLALAMFSVGRVAEAYQAGLRAAELRGESASDEEGDSFMALLGLIQDLGDPEAAQRRAKAVLAERPGDAAALMVLGMGAEAVGDTDVARASYGEVLEALPQFIPAIKKLAVLLTEHRLDDGRAYELAVRAREQLDDDPELARALGILEFRRGNSLSAAQLLRYSAASDPQDADVFFYLGLAQARLERDESALETLSRALELDPNNVMAGEAREVLAGN